ncbi:MAG: DUF642 domain-containing protein [Verrucomicrobiota bacterium]
MSHSTYISRRTLLLGLLIALCIVTLLWRQHLPVVRESSPLAAGPPVSTRAAETDPASDVVGSGGKPLQAEDADTPTSPTVANKPPVPREMDVAVNPYAAGLSGPGKSKRQWDAGYIEGFQQAKDGDPVSFELTDGVMASGHLKMVQVQNGIVSYVSGELTAPEKGRFFLLTPPQGSKAGKAVAIFEFAGSETAYRVEPTGVDGEPELWKRELDEVVCMNMEEAGAPDRETANIVPLRPDQAPEYVPSYNADIVSLQSLPGSPAVLLLDFAGGYTPHWGGVTYARAPVDNATIRDVWKRVAEDYMPFNINVTTDIKVFQAAPAASRQRCCLTPSHGGGGVAYIGSWNWGNDVVCWSGYYVGKAAAEVVSHEIGHTLGLAHDGRSTPPEGYFGGHGGGETGWAPIMGVGYYQALSQWSKGEYAFADQPQDDLSQITNGNNNVDYRVDDTGSTLAASRYLEVATNNSVSAEGVIEQTADTDAFQFTTTGGAVTLTANPVAAGDWANLAIMGTLADATGTVIATANVQSSVSATIATTLAAGTYTFRVTGTGKNDPLTNGFTSYASLGYYSITGTIAGARQPTRLSVVEHAATNTVVGTVPANNPNGSPLVYAITAGNTGGTFSVDNSGVVRVSNNALLDYYALAANPALYAAQFEVFVNITNVNNSSLTETNRRVVVTVQKFFPPVPVALAAVEDTSLRITLSWVGGQEATSYKVKRSTIAGGPHTTVGTSTGMNYTDSGLTHGVKYYYVVSAVNANGESANSTETSATPQAVAGFSFENPNLGGGFAYNPGGAIWTFGGGSGNGSGIAGNGSGFNNPNAPEGTQAALMQGTGSISQTLSGFAPGTTYEIRYAAAQRPGNVQTWDVKIDNTVIQSNPAGGSGYAPYATTFTATASVHTLSFAGTNLAGGDNTVFIDNVQVTIVTPVIANSSFETPAIANHQYVPAGGSWTFSGAGILRNGSAFGNASAPMGVQAAFLQTSGTISQTLSGFIPGTSYSLAYAAAQRPGNQQTWDVKIDNTVIQSNPAGGTGYITCKVNFLATSTSHTLTFAGTNLAGGDNTVFIDNVSLISPLQPVAASIALTSPTNNSVFNTPGTVNLTTSVTGNGNVINSVQFYADNAILLGQVTNAPYNFAWTNPGSGFHTVFARVLFNNGSSAESAAVGIVVVNTNPDLGFETPGLGGGQYQYNSTGGSWKFTGESGIVSNGSGFGNPNATQGAQAAFVQRVGFTSQILSGFVPGTNYTLAYSAAQRSGNQQTWDVKIDNAVIQSNPAGGSGYAPYSTNFTATAALHTVSFVGTNLAGGDNTVFIDDLRITVTPPPAPTGLAASAGDAQVTLNWAATPGATSYNVKRATVSGGPYTTVGSPTNNSYPNTGLTNGTLYYYVVSAVNAGGESANSSQVSATPQVAAPAAPAGVVATSGNSQVTVNWSASPGATSYNVKRSTVNGGPHTTVGTVATTSFPNTGLTNGTTYYYVVTALNAGGESAGSSQVSATPAAAFTNPGFEAPAIGAGNYQYNPTGGAWTFGGSPGNGSGLVANGSGFSNPNAAEGSQAAFVQTLGTMSQPLTGLTIGTTYTLTFAAAQRPAPNQNGGQSWNVKIDSLIVGSYNPGPAATSYVDYTATFTATATIHTLAFVGTNLATGDNTVFIDNIRSAITPPTLPSPWLRQDIGVTGAVSNASYAGGLFTFTGAGTNVAGTADSVSFLRQSSSGNCSITVRVASLQNTNANAKAGVMVRESLNANAREAGVWVTPGSGIVFTTRSSTGGTTTTTASTGKVAPYWVRLTRTSNSFAASYSTNGTTWTQLGSARTVSMSSSAFIGIGVESGDANQLNTATISNVTAVP